MLQKKKNQTTPRKLVPFMCPIDLNDKNIFFSKVGTLKRVLYLGFPLTIPKLGMMNIRNFVLYIYRIHQQKVIFFWLISKKFPGVFPYHDFVHCNNNLYPVTASPSLLVNAEIND